MEEDVQESATDGRVASLDGSQLALLDELENEVEAEDYLKKEAKCSLIRWSREEDAQTIGPSRRGSLAPSVEARLEKLREAEEQAALSAAAQQRRAQMSSRSRRKRDHRAFGDSIKSALIDSKVERFVASVPRLLPPPLGRFAIRDLRPVGGSSFRRAAALRDNPPGTTPPIRVVTWNVERGYRMAAVIACLRRELPDVVLLSEIDIGCDRSQMLDVGAEIASALGLCLVFATEKIKVNDESFYNMQRVTTSNDNISTTSASKEQLRWNKNRLGPKTLENNPDSVSVSTTKEDQISATNNEQAPRTNTLLNSLRTALSRSTSNRQQEENDGVMMTPVTPTQSTSEDDIILEDDADAFDGVEGVAVLTRFDADEIETIYLPDASKKNDPRKQRLALRVGCIVESDTLVDVIAVHLDAFAGRSSRVEQFTPVLDTWQKSRKKQRALIVGGDLNTHNSGLALLHPGMTGDDYFLSKLWRGQRLEPFQNQSEAEWWAERVFGHTSLVDPFEKSASSKHNPNIKLGGLRLWSGKLDWLLYDQHFFTCLDKHSSKADVASDHPYLRIDVKIKPKSEILTALQDNDLSPNIVQDKAAKILGLSSPTMNDDHHIYQARSSSGGLISSLRPAASRFGLQQQHNCDDDNPYCR